MLTGLNSAATMPAHDENNMQLNVADRQMLRFVRSYVGNHMNMAIVSRVYQQNVLEADIQLAVIRQRVVEGFGRNPPDSTEWLLLYYVFVFGEVWSPSCLDCYCY